MISARSLSILKKTGLVFPYGSETLAKSLKTRAETRLRPLWLYALNYAFQPRKA